MKPLTAKQLTAILKRNGFVLSRKKGSHEIWKNSETGAIVPVPYHGKSKPIPIGTFLAIRPTDQRSFYRNSQILATALRKLFSRYSVYASQFPLRLAQNLEIPLTKIFNQQVYCQTVKVVKNLI